MEFVTESGSTYVLKAASEDIDHQLYRVARTDSKGGQLEFIAEIMTRIPIEIGARVIFTVMNGDDEPSMLMTTRVKQRQV